MVRTPNELGALLKNRRRELGISQAELAKTVGASRPWIVDMERGKPRLEVGLVLRSVRALGLELQLVEAPAVSSKPELGVVPIDIHAVVDSARRK